MNNNKGRKDAFALKQQFAEHDKKEPECCTCINKYVVNIIQAIIVDGSILGFRKQTVLLTHGDTCTKVGNKLKIVGTCDETITALALEYDNIYGLQFHPEVDLTLQGKTILCNFISICGIKPSFTLQNRLTVCMLH